MSLLDRPGNRVGTQTGTRTYFRWGDWLTYARNVNARQLATCMARLGITASGPRVVAILAEGNPQTAGDMIAALQTQET